MKHNETITNKQGFYPVLLYEVHSLMSHPLRQVFSRVRLLHNTVVPHENTVKGWEDHNESCDQACDHNQHTQQAQNQPPADDEDANVVE